MSAVMTPAQFSAPAVSPGDTMTISPSTEVGTPIGTLTFGTGSDYHINSVTGENRITNGNFSDGLTGWTSDDSGSPPADHYTVVSGRAYHGPTTEKMKLYQPFIDFDQITSKLIGTNEVKLTVDFDYEVTQGTLRAEFRKVDGKVVTNSTTARREYGVTTTATHEHFEHTLTYGEVDYGAYSFMKGVAETGVTEFYVDNLVIRELYDAASLFAINANNEITVNGPLDPNTTYNLRIRDSASNKANFIVKTTAGTVEWLEDLPDVMPTKVVNAPTG